MQLVLASHNTHKVIELAALMPDSIKLVSLADLNFDTDIEENGATIEENAMIKARYIHRLTNLNVIADDTGLEVNHLKGAPGVHSARYAGDGKIDSDNVKKLLTALHEAPSREAQFKTCIASIINGNENAQIGICKGAIALQPSGLYGFGYDPVFIPTGSSRSFADMMLDEKNKYSHRAKAFAAFIAYFKTITV
jgi:XTP/dITP diphosphohydrolase